MAEGQIHTAWYCCRQLLLQALTSYEKFAETHPNFPEPEYLAFLEAGLAYSVMAVFPPYPADPLLVVIQVEKDTETQLFHFAAEQGVFYELTPERWARLTERNPGMDARPSVIMESCLEHRIGYVFTVWTALEGPSPRPGEDCQEVSNADDADGGACKGWVLDVKVERGGSRSD